MYKVIPTYNSKTNTWSETNFETRKDYITFVNSRYKKVGSYNLKNTKNWIAHRIKFLSTGGFEKNGRYIEHVKNSRKYEEFWRSEGIKCRRGVIFDDFFVTGYYYDYLNYSPIFNMIDSEITFPEVWDGHYHFFLYYERCILYGKHGLCNKKRRYGFSYLMASVFKNDFLFARNYINKIVTKEEPQLASVWKMTMDMIEFTNKYTGWYRQSTGSGYEIVQEYEGKIGNKKVTKGRGNLIKGVMTKLSSTRVVSGYGNKIFFEEAGINSTLDQSYEFVTPLLKIGGVVTGTIMVGGSVGELKDCEPLRRYTYKPEENGFLGEPDVIDPSKLVSFFVPQYWNYVHEIRDEDDPELIIGVEKCYDKDGNSNFKRAKELIELDDIKHSHKAPADYARWKSQNPSTLEDLFGARDNNIFPVAIVSRQDIWLEENYKEVTVDLKRETGKIIHSLNQRGIVTDFPIKPSSFKEGSICIGKLPAYTPLGLHVAGVDPVSSVESHKYQTSLMSIYIYKLAHELDGNLIGGELVAWYTGRYDNYHTTYEEVCKLIEFYNARALIESDNKGFIDWMIMHQKQEWMVMRSEVPILKELMPNSSIGDEYGIRMGSGENNIIKKYCFEKLIEFLEEQIGIESFEVNGETLERIIYGVSKVKDRMLLKEMLNWDPKKNVDRIIAAAITIMYGRLLESRNIFYKLKERDLEKKPTTNNFQSLNSIITTYKVPNSLGYKNARNFRLK